MSNGKKKSQKKYKNLNNSPSINRKNYDNIFNDEIILKLNNSQKKENNIKPNQKEKNINQINLKNNDFFSQKQFNKRHNSLTYDLKSLSIKRNSDIKHSILKEKSCTIKNYHSNSFLLKNKLFYNLSPKKLPKKAKEGIKILQHSIKINFQSNKINQKNKKENTENNKNKLENCQSNKLNQNFQDSSKIEKEKERKYKKIKIKFIKRENCNKKNYRSLSKERDRRRMIQNIINNEDNSSSLNQLNSKLNSLIENINNLQSISLNLKNTRKLSSSMAELHPPNCQKLINKIRSQKKIREMYYD